MNLVLAALVVVTTAGAVVWAGLYMRAQRRACAKYPFYALRDRILLAIVDSDQPECLDRIYQTVNDVVHHVHRFNFPFFVEFLTQMSEGIIDRAYRQAVSERQDRLELDLNEFEVEYVRLVLRAARQNSLSIRLATTRLGMVLVFPPTLVTGLLRFLRKHPELYRSVEPRIHALRKFALLSHSV